MARASRVVVLVEDSRHQRFVRRYLTGLGYTHHDMAFEPLPGDRGCGEKWVRERYARAVAAYRNSTARAKTALVVAIDADTQKVAHRSQQLGGALSAAGLEQRDAAEAIAHLIPKRNIETWILCLAGNTVDEATDYRRAKGIDESIPSGSTTLFQSSRLGAPVPPYCVPSLSTAIPELRRLESTP